MDSILDNYHYMPTLLKLSPRQITTYPKDGN